MAKQYCRYSGKQYAPREPYRARLAKSPEYHQIEMEINDGQLQESHCY